MGLLRRVLARAVCCVPLAVVTVIAVSRWPTLWEEIPSHWTADGQVDGLSPEWPVVAVPFGVTLVIAVVAVFADPDDAGRAPYFWGLGIGSGFAFAAAVLSASLLSDPARPDSVVWLIASPLFLLVGFVQFLLIPRGADRTQPGADALGTRW